MGIIAISGAVLFSAIAGAPSQSDKRILGVEQEKFVSNSSQEDQTQGLFVVENFYSSGKIRSYQDFIESEKIVVYPEDKVKVFPEPELGIGFRAQITRALAVRVIDGKRESLYRTFSTRVTDLLQEKKIELGDKDMIDPALNSQLVKGIVIKIIRVSEVEVKQNQKIDFEVIYEDDASLDKGLTQIKRAGEKGAKELTYLVRREDGEEVSRELKKTEIVKKSVAKIILRGTREVIYGVGKATWFGAPAMSAAHNSLARGTMVEVTNLDNGKKVVVKIIGGGILSNAIIDLSPDAFSQLAPLSNGVIKVKVAKP